MWRILKRNLITTTTFISINIKYTNDKKDITGNSYYYTPNNINIKYTNDKYTNDKKDITGNSYYYTPNNITLICDLVSLYSASSVDNRKYLCSVCQL